jgi:hypothetical protein
MTGGLVLVSTDVPEFEDIVDAFITRDFAYVSKFAESLIHRPGPVQALQLSLIGLCRTGAFGKAHWFAQIAIDRLQGEDAWSAGLIGLAIGKTQLLDVVNDTLNDVENCQARYYTAAAKISNGKIDDALADLDVCLANGAPCLELHLATVEKDNLAVDRHCG